MPELANSPKPVPNEKLIKVFDSEQENEAIVVQGLLQSGGIESDLKSLDAVQDTFPGVGGTVIPRSRRVENCNSARGTVLAVANR